MHWVIQENIFNEVGYNRLIETLIRFDIPHSIVKIIPFSNELVEDINPVGNCIVMGGYTMWKIAKAKGWTPGSFINKNFDYRIQNDHWQDYMFNHNCSVERFDSVPYQYEPFFIRPIYDSKSFTGQVMEWEEFDLWRKSVINLQTSYCSIRKDDLVQICDAKHIYAEYRLWVVEGKIVTSSLYKRGGRVYSDEDVDPEIIEFGYQCIHRWGPARAYCLDIFVGEDGPKIGEVNNINAAGFYKADIQKLILALNEMKF